MATTRPIRWNLQAGVLGSSLAATDTTINLGSVPSFPTLSNAASGDYIPITLINSTALQSSEIVYLTGYTAGNSTGQILRAQESLSGGGAAASFAQGQTWQHAPTAVEQVRPQALQMAGNTTGTSLVLSTGQVSFAGGNNVTLSQDGAGNAITISAHNNYMSMWPYTPVSTILSNTLYSGSAGAGNPASTATTVSAYVMPMPLDNPLYYNEIRIPVQLSATTTVTSVNWSFTQGLSLGLYTLNAGSLSLVSSFTNKMLFSHNSTNTSGSASATFQMFWGGSATQHTSQMTLSTNTATAAGFWTALSGSKMVPMMTGSSATLTEGQYFAVVAASHLTAGSTLSAGIQSIGHFTGAGNLTHLQDVGLTSTGGTTGIYPLMGLMSFVLNSNTSWPLTLASQNITTSSNNASFVNRSIYVHMLMRTT